MPGLGKKQILRCAPDKLKRAAQKSRSENRLLKRSAAAHHEQLRPASVASKAASESHAASSNATLGTGWMIANPDPLRLNDPQTPGNVLNRKSADSSLETRNTRNDRLIRRSQNDNAWRSTWVVTSGVCKVGIQRDQNPFFALADFLDSVVLSAGQ
jgi:hypothetical protein